MRNIISLGLFLGVSQEDIGFGVIVEFRIRVGHLVCFLSRLSGEVEDRDKFVVVVVVARKVEIISPHLTPLHAPTRFCHSAAQLGRPPKLGSSSRFIIIITTQPATPRAMAAQPNTYKDRQFLAVIGDEVYLPFLTLSRLREKVCMCVCVGSS